MRTLRRTTRASSQHPSPSDLPVGIIGRYCGVDSEGRSLVSIDDGTPMVAKTTIPEREQLPCGASVVLIFEAADPEKPIIVGMVRETRSIESEPVAAAAGEAVTVTMKRLVVEADHEIVFRCGAGSITLRVDGTIVLRGSRLLSRASETNRIRGATVKIN